MLQNYLTHSESRRHRLTVDALTPSSRARLRMPGLLAVGSSRRSASGLDIECRVCGRGRVPPEAILAARARENEPSTSGPSPRHTECVGNGRHASPASNIRMIRLRTTSLAGAVRLRDHRRRTHGRGQTSCADVRFVHDGRSFCSMRRVFRVPWRASSRPRRLLSPRRS